MDVPATHAYDTLHMGRSSIDLYANEVGARFVNIETFSAYVGGSPTNISVAARRLGLKSVLLTAVGEDPVGDFVLEFLQREKVETRFIARKAGRRTSAVLLGIEPPDRFPLVYYRENCADIELTIDDVAQAPIQRSRFFQFAGTNLSRDPSRNATLFAAELARRANATVVLDLDFRPDQWYDARAFGVAIRSALRVVDIVLGTEDEIRATAIQDRGSVRVTHSQVSGAQVRGDTPGAIRSLLSSGPGVVVEKRGAAGARVHLGKKDQEIESVDVPGFAVQVKNVLGAGDAFAAGVLYGRVHQWDWYKSTRMGNACGAILVTKHGCANFMPTLEEVEAFVQQQGGW